MDIWFYLYKVNILCKFIGQMCKETNIWDVDISVEEMSNKYHSLKLYNENNKRRKVVVILVNIFLYIFIILEWNNSLTM